VASRGPSVLLALITLIWLITLETRGSLSSQLPILTRNNARSQHHTVSSTPERCVCIPHLATKLTWCFTDVYLGNLLVHYEKTPKLIHIVRAVVKFLLWLGLDTDKLKIMHSFTKQRSKIGFFPLNAKL
jgi:hypothetical protein